MNRRLILSLLFCLLLIPCSALSAGESQDKLEVMGNNSERKISNSGIIERVILKPNQLMTMVRSARVREEPSFDAAVEYGLKRGDFVTVLTKSGEWNYVVRKDGKKGWGHDSIFFPEKTARNKNIALSGSLVSMDKPEGYSEPTAAGDKVLGSDKNTSGLENKDETSMNVSSEPTAKQKKALQLAGGDGLEKEATQVKDYEDMAPDKSVEETSSVQKKNTLTKEKTSKSDISIHWSDNERLSINFLNVDIREALSALALEREINIATSQEIAGKITVHLYNVSLDKALEAITLSGGFSFTKKGDLYYVFKPKEAQDPQAERLQMKIFKLKYAELGKVQEILNSIPGCRPIKIHDSTKTIIAEDTPKNIKKIESIINQWDQMPRQVMIEAKILEITLTDDMAFGVNWSDILGSVKMGTGSLSRAILPSTASDSPVPAEGSGLFANLITAAGTSKQFAAALDALQSKTNINTLSTPKILAIHGKPAKVQVGGQQGYAVTTVNDGVSTESIEFIDTGTILEITPFIDDENNILLDVRPSIKSARIEEGIPVVNSTEVSTWLTAKNGQTVFIGGLIQDSKSKTRDMVPCLGGAFGVGALFGRTRSNIGKSELVVLITPNILDSRMNTVTSEAIKKTKIIEEDLKKRPLPPVEQMIDFLSPMD